MLEAYNGLLKDLILYASIDILTDLLSLEVAIVRVGKSNGQLRLLHFGTFESAIIVLMLCLIPKWV